MNDSVSNYSEIEIYFMNDGNYINTTKAMNNTNVSLNTIHSNTSGYLYINSRVINVNGNAITTLDNRYSKTTLKIYSDGENENATEHINNIKIYKVVGYK